MLGSQRKLMWRFGCANFHIFYNHKSAGCKHMQTYSFAWCLLDFSDFLHLLAAGTRLPIVWNRPKIKWPSMNALTPSTNLYFFLVAFSHVTPFLDILTYWKYVNHTPASSMTLWMTAEKLTVALAFYIFFNRWNNVLNASLDTNIDRTRYKIVPWPMEAHSLCLWFLVSPGCSVKIWRVQNLEVIPKVIFNGGRQISFYLC